MRYFATLDNAEREPDLLFRTSDGGPPFESYDPRAATWAEDATLVDYFTGDAMGLLELHPEQVPDVVALLHRKAADAGA